MAEKPEDLNLPAAVVARIIKEALPQNCNVAKEAKQALAKAASVFVLYLTAEANHIATGNNRKTITNNDVLQALEELEFGKFLEPLSEAAIEYKKIQISKKESLNKKKVTKEENAAKKDEEMNGSELTEQPDG